MSRIILSRYSSGEEHVVVGWDRPMQTFFWQEFNAEPRNPVTGDVDWDSPEAEEWEEMLGFAGYSPYEIPTTEVLFNSAVNNKAVFDALTIAMERGGIGGFPEVMFVLKSHMDLEAPESNVQLDLSETHKA